MKRWGILFAAMLVPCVATASPAPYKALGGLSGENLLMSLPKGFKLGAQSNQGRFNQFEYIAQTDTVQDWSVMITLTIIQGQVPRTPDQMSQTIADGFQRICAHGEGHKLSDGVTNGYAYTEWMVTCDLNPQTNKPEFLVMRTSQAANAFYNVQYAFRAAPTDEFIKQARDYLQSTSICDNRIPEQACKKP